MAAPQVATLWIGQELRWIDKLCLTSCVSHGHAVTLYHTHALKNPGIDGVTLLPAHELFGFTDDLLARLSPAAFADLFRLTMIQETDLVWVDSDVICMRPFVVRDGYLMGHESDDIVNNAVLRLPQTSQALDMLQERLTDPAYVPEWFRRRDQDRLAILDEGERLLAAADIMPNAFGPRALTWALNETGEITEALPTPALNPVHWAFTDAYFNPHGGVEGWLTPETQAVHLYASRIRAVHLRVRPDPNSFIGKIAQSIGFNLSDHHQDLPHDRRDPTWISSQH